MAQNKAVIKALKILELISKSKDGVTLSEISKELDMPKATTFDILKALYQEDAIYFKNEKTKTYVIGSKMFTIGEKYIKNSNFIEFSQELLKDFANKYNATCFATKRIGRTISYIYKYESPRVRLFTENVGDAFPLYNSAAGLTFLAFTTNEKRKDLIDRMIKKDFGGNANDLRLKKMKEEIEKIQFSGCYISNGVHDKLTFEVACPVYNFESKETGVLYASRVAFDENESDLESKCIKEFTNIARIVSKRQGYQE